MKTGTPIAFAFEDSAVRIIPDAEKPLFVASDVATALGYEKTRNAIARHCKHQTTAPKQGGGFITLIDESDVYRLIFGSKLESAERFQNWVFEEVLPAIRKNGGYGVLAPADEIRYMNQRLALLKELMRARSPRYREDLYAQYKIVSERLGFAVPALSEYHPPHPHDLLDDGTRAVLDAFWHAYHTLTGTAIGLPLNHHRDPGLIAINLKEILARAEENGIPMPSRAELLRVLPQCREPVFIGASVTVASIWRFTRKGIADSVRCYLFRKTA